MLKVTSSGLEPVMVAPVAAGVDLKTAFGGWLPVGFVPPLTVTGAVQRALWVDVRISNDAV